MTRRKGIVPKTILPQGTARRSARRSSRSSARLGTCTSGGPELRSKKTCAMIADSVAFLRGPGSKSFTTPSISSTATKHNPDYALQTRWPPPRGAAQPARALRHQRRLAARGSRRGGRRRARRYLKAPSASIRTTMATSPSPIPWPPSPRRVAGSRHHQRHRRALRQRRLVQRGRQSRPQIPGLRCARTGQLARLTEVSRYVYETANMNFRTGPAVCRHERVRP